MAELQWRRKWKPDLFSCSWRQLDLQDDDGKKFLIKAKFDENSYELLITDLTMFWSEKLADNSLKKRISKLNPNIEAPLTKILDQIQARLEKDSKETKLSLNEKDGILFLKVESQLSGMPFIFNFHCERCDKDIGRDHLTIPLMAMVGELYRQQQELFKILAAKDKEIDDYKAQGVKTTRKHNETVPFDSVAFRNSMITSKGFENEVRTFGEQAFTSLGQELYKEITTKRVWLTSAASNTGNEDAKAEEETMDGVAGAPSVESWANRLPTSLVQPSPTKASPTKSPGAASPASSKSSSTETTPVKDSEYLRRQALERKLEEEEAKQKAKKKKKLKF